MVPYPYASASEGQANDGYYIAEEFKALCLESFLAIPDEDD